MTDPGYFHFVPALRLAGAEPVWVRLSARGGWRLDPDEVAAALTPRTKMVVVCDPVNPFGTVQRARRARGPAAPVRRAAAWCCSRTRTHAAPPRRPGGRHHSLAALAAEHPGATVLWPAAWPTATGWPPRASGPSAARRTWCGPACRSRSPPCGSTPTCWPRWAPWPPWATRAGSGEGEAIIRRNLAALREAAPLVIAPEYGFSCVVDCADLGASAQEIMVALCRRRVAVYPGDGLGEVGATTTIRLNLSDPDPRALSGSRRRGPRRWPRRAPGSGATGCASSSCPPGPTGAGAWPPWWARSSVTLPRGRPSAPAGR